jgi:hypothetical protein
VIVNLMILMSQTVNVLFGGDPDEMLSARCWRLRCQAGWKEMCWVLDNASPLMWWKGSYATHCEACYWEERRRLKSRLKDYGEN